MEPEIVNSSSNAFLPSTYVNEELIVSSPMEKRIIHFLESENIYMSSPIDKCEKYFQSKKMRYMNNVNNMNILPFRLDNN